MAAEMAPDAAPEPLSQFTARLGDITKQAGHGEMWGVELSSDAGHAPTQVVLQKFLRANSGDAVAAEKQLVAALEWRKKMQPASLVTQAFDRHKFGGVGFVTTHSNDAGKETVITWNVYGSVKDNKATFGDVQEFVKWRTALMELGVQQLRLNDIKEPLPENGTDEYQMLQVHGYQSVSFFRMDPDIKAASKETISVFSTAYPELLSHKYFVNVPVIMGWMFGAMKLFLAPATLKKFHPMTSGTTLSVELKDIASSLPKEYGGKGPSVQEGMTVAFADDDEAPKEEKTTTESEDAPVESKEVPAEAEQGKTPAEAKEEPLVESKNETRTESQTEETPESTDAPVPAAAEPDAKPTEETAPVEDTKPAAETAKTEAAKTETGPNTADAPPKETEAAPTEAETAPKEAEATTEAAQPAKTE